MITLKFLSKAAALALTFCLIKGAHAQSLVKHSAFSSFTSYKGLIMAGYQGWFNTAGDGASRGWNHYSTSGDVTHKSVKIDLWPEVSEYTKTYKTPFTKSDGSSALLFSSYDSSTVDLHFKWMQQYGLDGVFMQRFVVDVTTHVGRRANDRVFVSALRSSKIYRRAFALMYDLSGMNDDDYQKVIDDFKHLVDDLHLTREGSRQTYLYHRGKPLVAFWGVGFSDHRKYHLSTVEKLINFFKNDPLYGGCSVLLGVPAYWRDLKEDADSSSHLLHVVCKADILQPWFVGRYSEATYPLFKARISLDLNWCKTNGIDYAPTVFPGFSWHNMYPSSPQNQIPRNRGLFYWQQLSGAIKLGAEMLYVAMFDELDEGTAIFKISKNPPEELAPFVSFEKDIPEDYYLFLTGIAGKVLKKQLPLTERIPPYK